MNSLRIESLTITFDREVLNHVSYTFEAGRVYLIQGPSGIGKSSLLNAMGLLRRPTDGKVFADDTDLWAMSDQARADFRLANFGFVFQAHNLIGGLTLTQNLMVPLLKMDIAKDQQTHLLAETLEQLGLSDRANTLASDLSGGEDQRGAIGRALITNAKVIFADEPSSALDKDKAMQIYETLATLAHEAGKIVIIVSHETLPISYADVVLTLEDGRLVEQASRQPVAVSEPQRDSNPVKPVPFLSVISRQEAARYNRTNPAARKQLPLLLLVVVTVLLCLSSIILTMPQVIAQQQQLALSRATDNTLFVTNDTLHSGSSQDLDAFRNLSPAVQATITHLSGVKHVYPYYTFTSYGLTKDNVRAPQPQTTKLSIGGKQYAIAKTFSVEPLYAEMATKSFLFTQPVKDAQSGLVVAQTWLDQNHISSHHLVGKTLAMQLYVPYAQFQATSELPDNNQKTVATDGNIYATYNLNEKIIGILASNYPYLRSEYGNALFMPYREMQATLEKAAQDHPLTSQIFASFKQQPFGYSALEVEAKTFNDTPALGKAIQGINSSLHVASTAEDVDALNKSVQTSQQAATNLAVLIVLGTIATLMITFFLTSRSRMREVGILKAVGFATADIRRLLTLNGLRYSTIMFGLAELVDVIALLAIQRYFFIYSPQFLLSTTLANALLAYGVVLVASLLPIRRLSKLDPVTIIAQS